MHSTVILLFPHNNFVRDNVCVIVWSLHYFQSFDFSCSMAIIYCFSFAAHLYIYMCMFIDDASCDQMRIVNVMNFWFGFRFCSLKPSGSIRYNNWKLTTPINVLRVSTPILLSVSVHSVEINWKFEIIIFIVFACVMVGCRFCIHLEVWNISIQKPLVFLEFPFFICWQYFGFYFLL